VARWPGKIKPGTVTDHLSAFWDVMPTIAQITGTTPPEQIDGISFAPTLLGRPQEQKEHEYLYWEFPGYGGQQAVRADGWKAVRQNILRKKNPHPLKIELYNLDDDIGEENDVAAEHPDRVAEMRRMMEREHTPSKLFPMPPLD